ncbi:MAG: cytochrome c-type biogenesis protein CcmH [Myxococcales bacterium]|nr:cytochrome c-type biogenesis protein CcmH [Myxococcales bacterium]
MRMPSALTILLATSLAAGSALAQETSAEAARRAVDLERELMSPFCPGLTLYSCTSPNAAVWRSDIHAMVRQGVSSEEIRTRLQARVPGFDLTGRPAGDRSWTLPVAAGVLATLLLVVALARMRRRRPGDTEEPLDTAEPGTDDESLEARIDEELENLDAA